MLVNLSQRHLEGELMDAPDLSPQVHQKALQGLRRINQWSGTASVLSSAIKAHWKRHPSATLRILDLACGGGDVTVNLARQLQRANIPAEVFGWDRSAVAIEFARKQHSQSCPNIRFEVADALNDVQPQSFDIVCCTLFLHHMSNCEAAHLLTQMYQGAKQLVLIDDLRRSSLGYGLAILACHLLSRSPIVHVDGPLSVRAAFNEREIIELSDQCKLPRPTIRRHWPVRFLLAWKVLS